MAKTFALPPDAELAGREAILDCAALAPIFQRELEGFAEGRLELQRLKVKSFSHERGRQCRMSYALRVREAGSGREGEQSLFAIVALDGGAETRYREARRGRQLAPEFGPAVQLLPDLDMVVWGFPNDPQLPQLQGLLDDGELLALLRQRQGELALPPGARLAGVDTVLVKAIAERRCTLRHTLDLEGAAPVVVYSKSFADPRDAVRLHDTMRALWDAPVRRSGVLSIPQPLFVERSTGVLFVRDLGGSELRADLGGRGWVRTGTDVGRVLAGLHQCTIEGLPRRPDDALLHQCTQSLTTLEGADGATTARLGRVVDELARRRDGLTPLPEVPIHGAFRLAQLLCVEDGLALIDFDGFCLGNPLADVGGFLANLLYLPIHGRSEAAPMRTLGEAFCRAYEQSAPWGLPEDQLVWQTVGHLVGKHVKRSVKSGKSDQDALVAGLLELAEQLLAGEVELRPALAQEAP